MEITLKTICRRDKAAGPDAYCGTIDLNMKGWAATLDYAISRPDSDGMQLIVRHKNKTLLKLAGIRADIVRRLDPRSRLILGLVADVIASALGVFRAQYSEATDERISKLLAQVGGSLSQEAESKATVSLDPKAESELLTMFA